jgi:hypothetical protein
MRQVFVELENAILAVELELVQVAWANLVTLTLQLFGSEVLRQLE